MLRMVNSVTSEAAPKKNIPNQERGSMNSSRTYRFVQLDVFTEQPFAGNPLAVFPDADALTDTEMQRIAREMNLSETVFVCPSDKALRRLRIFTPLHELPFAGHPVVGTWNLLAREGLVPPPATGTNWSRIEHELGIGVLPVEIEFADGEPVRVVMTQGRFEMGEEIIAEKAMIAEGLGLQLVDLHQSLPVRTVSTGLPFLAVPVGDLGALGRCRINPVVLADAASKFGALSCYVFTTETKESGSAAHARMFVPNEGIAEDPATGSAAGALGAYLVQHEALSVAAQNDYFQFVIEQGDFMKRPSRISVEVQRAAKSIAKVRVGGSSVIVVRGELIF